MSMWRRNLSTISGIPALGFGTYPLADGEADAAIRMALEVGFRHIDTAQMYGNEAAIGAALRAAGTPRGELFLTTKVQPSNLTKAAFLPSVKRSLADLQTERVDLLLIHWPPGDAAMIEPLIDQLNAAAEQGLARLIGVSNFPVAYLRRAVAASARPLATNQVEFHPLIDQSKLKAAADTLAIPLTAYCPLARGQVLSHHDVVEIANRLGEAPSAVVLAWIRQQGVIAVPMTTKRANAEANFRSLSITLEAKDLTAISALTKVNRRLVAPSEMAQLWD
jgi:2,5-diketo-D-gluconate reductase B